MDLEDKKRLRETAKLEAKFGHLAEEYSEDDEMTKNPMPMQGASLREIDRIREKRREKRKQ